MADETKVGVAVSGGGHRAALFGLGALLYLIDAGKGPQLGSISSVSGGSLTNAHLGRIDLSTATPTQVWAHSRILARQLVRRGTLWAAPVTWLYLLSMPLLLVVAAIITCLGPDWAAWPAWVIAIASCAWLSQQRSAVAALAFDSTFLNKTRLDALHGKVSHVMCASDIQTGQAVYFSHNFVYSWRSGWGTPGRLRAARAAQASAALPGAFSVVSLPLRRFGLPEARVADRTPPKRFMLLDGGVYDNMGSEWLLALSDRLGEGTPPVGLSAVSEVVVVNASAGEGVTTRRGVRIPLVGELLSLLAVKDVMYRQTTAVRRRLLDVRYRIATSRDDIEVSAPILSEALRGATIQIDRSPFTVVDAFRRGRPDDFSRRAAAALDLLGEENRDFWSTEAAANRAVKTTLSRIDFERAQSLIRHAYVLAMVNTHVLLDYPLFDVPDSGRFAELVSK